MDDKYDCIVVGAGVAGLSDALTLARNNLKFLRIEKGKFPGSKNVSGGVLWGSDLAKLVPSYWEDPNAGWDRFINHRRDRKSTRLNSSHVAISYAVFCLKKKIYTYI